MPKVTKKNRAHHERHVSQPFIVVGSIITNDEKKLLLVNENGKWNHPAGWLELGERLIDGARREAEEETGYKISVDGLLGIYSLIKNRTDKVLHAIKFIFRAHLTGTKISSKDKIPFRWFTPNEIRNLAGQLWDDDLINIVRDWESGVSYPLDIANAYTVINQKSKNG